MKTNENTPDAKSDKNQSVKGAQTQKIAGEVNADSKNVPAPKPEIDLQDDDVEVDTTSKSEFDRSNRPEITPSNPGYSSEPERSKESKQGPASVDQAAGSKESTSSTKSGSVQGSNIDKGSNRN